MFAARETSESRDCRRPYVRAFTSTASRPKDRRPQAMVERLVHQAWEVSRNNVSRGLATCTRWVDGGRRIVRCSPSPRPSPRGRGGGCWPAGTVPARPTKKARRGVIPCDEGILPRRALGILRRSVARLRCPRYRAPKLPVIPCRSIQRESVLATFLWRCGRLKLPSGRPEPPCNAARHIRTIPHGVADFCAGFLVTLGRSRRRRSKILLHRHAGRQRSIGRAASVSNGKSIRRPWAAEAYAAMTISNTARPSSPVTRGGLSSRTHSTKWAISCGKP